LIKDKNALNGSLWLRLLTRECGEGVVAGIDLHRGAGIGVGYLD
jgi:hypothetical protein